MSLPDLRPTVHAREHDVEYHQVVGVGQRMMKTFFPIPDKIDDEAGLDQSLLEVVPSFRLIFNDQDLHVAFSAIARSSPLRCCHY